MFDMLFKIYIVYFSVLFFIYFLNKLQVPVVSSEALKKHLLLLNCLKYINHRPAKTIYEQNEKTLQQILY